MGPRSRCFIMGGFTGLHAAGASEVISRQQRWLSTNKIKGIGIILWLLMQETVLAERRGVYRGAPHENSVGSELIRKNPRSQVGQKKFLVLIAYKGTRSHSQREKLLKVS